VLVTNLNHSSWLVGADKQATDRAPARKVGQWAVKYGRQQTRYLLINLGQGYVRAM